MKFYISYAVRSLQRDLLRTLLALTCIAIAVMSMVALQLSGQMVQLSLLSNVRDLNGGDLSIIAKGQTFTPSDLTFFQQLQEKGIVASFSPVWSSTLTHVGSAQTQLSAIQPTTYPVVSLPQWITPLEGSLPQFLYGDQVVVDQQYADQQHKYIGDHLILRTLSPNNQEVTLPVRIAGIFKDSGHFATSTGLIIISQQSFLSLTHTRSLTYNALDLSTNNNQSHTNTAYAAIKKRLPHVTISTVEQVQHINQQSVTVIQKFLQSVGLLTLLIAGIGIMNTLRVFLARRVPEIAALKAVGYRRRDLYLLFGCEAALLGLCGGMAGAILALGVSYILFLLLQHLFSIVTLAFVLNPLTAAEGPIIGMGTAVLFGWLPIVQAGAIPPIALLRDTASAAARQKTWLTRGLLAVWLSVIFCIAATFLLDQDWFMGIAVVYGALFVLLCAGLLFSLLLKWIGSVSFPDRYSKFFWWYTGIGSVGIVISVFVLTISPNVGSVMLACLLLLLVLLLFLPKNGRVAINMALRNLNRQRFSTTTGLVVLFIGIFAIGLVLILGSDIRAQVQNLEHLSYNLVITVPARSVQPVLQQTQTLEGVHQQNLQHHPVTTVQLSSLAGNLPMTGAQTQKLSNRGQLEGFDLAQGQLPDAAWTHLLYGRTLVANDAHTHNILLVNQFAEPDLIGKVFLLKDEESGKRITVTIVGIVSVLPQVPLQSTLLAPQELVTSIAAPHQPAQTFYFSLDPAYSNEVITTLHQIEPDSIFVANTVSILDIMHRFFDAAIALLLALGGLAILAAFAVIANTVSLALIERTREMGILKAVGYTSWHVLELLLIENAVLTAIAALASIMAIILITELLSVWYRSPLPFVIPWYLVSGLFFGAVTVVSLITLLVASRATKVRPLEVLRYE